MGPREGTTIAGILSLAGLIILYVAGSPMAALVAECTDSTEIAPEMPA